MNDLHATILNYPFPRSISVQVCDRGIPKLCSSIEKIELKPPPHQPMALCVTKDPAVLKTHTGGFDCDNPSYKIEDFGPNVNSVSVNDENNVDIPTHLLNGDYFICPVECGGDGAVQYTAVGSGNIDGTAFRFEFSIEFPHIGTSLTGSLKIVPTCNIELQCGNPNLDQ